MLIQDLQLTNRKKELTVYGPEGTERKIKWLQKMFLIPPDIYPFELNVKEYQEDTVYDNVEIQMRFFKTRHLSQEFWRKLDEHHGIEINPVAYGMDIRLNDHKIIVSGDLLPVLDGASLVI